MEAAARDGCLPLAVVGPFARNLLIIESEHEADSLYPSGTLRIDELTAEERAVYATLKPERLPEHVAIIMDGNGRWAGHRSLKRFLGHQQGAKSVQLVTETASRIGCPGSRSTPFHWKTICAVPAPRSTSSCGCSRAILRATCNA